MKAIRIAATAFAVICLTSCKPKTQSPAQQQQQPQQSPECLAAIKDAQDSKTKRDLTNLKVRESIETDRIKIRNLELEDQLARQDGRMPKNGRAIALLRNKIDTNETTLRLDAELGTAPDTISQSLIDAACTSQQK